jgi:hypothetical protein
MAVALLFLIQLPPDVAFPESDIGVRLRSTSWTCPDYAVSVSLKCLDAASI